MLSLPLSALAATAAFSPAPQKSQPIGTTADRSAELSWPPDPLKWAIRVFGWPKTQRGFNVAKGEPNNKNKLHCSSSSIFRVPRVASEAAAVLVIYLRRFAAKLAALCIE